jgi:predicted acyl esterase
MRDDIVSVAGQYPDYVPGSIVELELNFAPNAFKLAPGEQLRLDISSSCWPYFLPHRNRKGNFWEMERCAIAHNTLFTGASELILFER